MWWVLLTEWNAGHIKVIYRPEDVISPRGSPSVEMNCTVEGMTHRDVLSWWKTVHGERTLIYTTSPSASQESAFEGSEKYEIRGHYNLFIKNVVYDDAAVYSCEISGMRNLSAKLTVVGEFVSMSLLIS